MKKLSLFCFVLVLLATALLACQPKVTESVVLSIVSGDKTTGYTLTQLKEMDQMNTDYTDKEGNVTTYTGVSLKDLLAATGYTGTTVTLTAADEYSAELSLDEVNACAGCIVAIDAESGALRTVMPDLSGKVNVKDLVSITIK